MQISRLFSAHHVDTDTRHCQEHFDARMDVYKDRFYSKVNRAQVVEQGGLGSCTKASVSRKS